MKNSALVPLLVPFLVQLPRRFLQGLVRVYRFWFKPWLGNSCRFEPSCSAYALAALQQHGAVRGAALSGWRLLRCQPWCEGGCDPVPAAAPAAGLFTRLILNPKSADLKPTDFSSRKSP
jgi:uncharacterized protein